jgi:hypothetical protein
VAILIQIGSVTFSLHPFPASRRRSSLTAKNLTPAWCKTKHENFQEQIRRAGMVEEKRLQALQFQPDRRLVFHRQ